ncbi:hypothetical protein PHMEG_0006028 [Phytophthora megakarya]|uniref:Uncharacterized protein n=1 Tax=Phytophthora megakarya TaxID=4795 RepID=A0A225WRJ8_9STRA|nr:hypothetical protein PHMEG_0006028 [Phytophthora megakarya]
MNLNDLKPTNTKQAHTASLAALERYLVSEGTSTAHVGTLITRSSEARDIMANFGFHLAFQDGICGTSLFRHSVAHYYCQVKCWFMDLYAQN